MKNNVAEVISDANFNCFEYSSDPSNPLHPNNLFVNWRNWDYRPKAGSALIGAGNSTNVPTLDIEGSVRTLPFDIGCYEYVPSVGRSPSPLASTPSLLVPTSATLHSSSPTQPTSVSSPSSVSSTRSSQPSSTLSPSALFFLLFSLHLEPLTLCRPSRHSKPWRILVKTVSLCHLYLSPSSLFISDVKLDFRPSDSSVFTFQSALVSASCSVLRSLRSLNTLLPNIMTL